MDLNLDYMMAMGIRIELQWETFAHFAMLELGVQEFQSLWSSVRSSSILFEPLCMKRTSYPSQLREEEGVDHHGVILSSDVILKHKRPNQTLRRNSTPHQDFLGMQSGFVNLMWMLSVAETHFLSVNVPSEVKIGFITKTNNMFQSVRYLLQVITEFLHKTSQIFSAHSCQRLEDIDLVRMHA
jgi:hypothetical protein